jgi:hypothetical protein
LLEGLEVNRGEEKKLGLQMEETVVGSQKRKGGKTDL